MSDTTTLDAQLNALRKELQTVRLDRANDMKQHETLCQEKEQYHGFLKAKIERAFKTVDKTLRIEAFYSSGSSNDNDSSEKRPGRRVMDYQSRLLSRSMRTLAQTNDLKLTRKQIKLTVRYLMTAKWSVEDEKEQMEQKHASIAGMYKTLMALLKNKYMRQIQIHRMVLSSLRCKLNIQEPVMNKGRPPMGKRWTLAMMGMRGMAPSTKEEDKSNSFPSPTTTTATLTSNPAGFRFFSRQSSASTMEIRSGDDISELMMAALQAPSLSRRGSAA